MDLEVLGRHALLFDDDSMAAFVNSKDALVEWNSLLIDRYDVRHLLSSPPPPRRRRSQSSSPPPSSSFDSDLDSERYLDLPPPSEDNPEFDEEKNLGDAESYRAVGFSYGSVDSSTEKKNADSELGSSGFRPPFPVPESLLQSLPSSEKIHQIIARTAMFVSKSGGQSEIVLRVKQGDNPTFGFLMPGHQLHAYYRFLVDHQELLQSDFDAKVQNEHKTDMDSNEGDVSKCGALSLLGAIYGSGEDDDAAADSVLLSDVNVSRETAVAVAAPSHNKGRAVDNAIRASKDLTIRNHLHSGDKIPKSGISSVTSASKSGSMRKEVSRSYADKYQDSDLTVKPNIEALVAEPPSDIKRLVDKIVEYVLKNGKQFEATLIEQDTKHGRFPFLLPSNQYHSYYMRVLQKAQESKVSGKNFSLGKTDSVGHASDKRKILSNGADNISPGCDIPYDSDRKEKFKMVIGKSKKDGLDPSPKATEPQLGVSVDASAAAAILKAATRGIKFANFGFLSTTSLNGSDRGPSCSDGAQASSSQHLSQPFSTIPQPEQNVERSVPAPVAKALTKTAALEVASEADSSEAHLTREEKLKAERLKRAKMFVSMLKSGTATSKTEQSGDFSEKPKASGIMGSIDIALSAKERDGSSAPPGNDTAEKADLSERKHSGDEYNERRSRRKYRHKRHEEAEHGDEDKEHKHSRGKCHSSEDGKQEEDDELLDGKYFRKKRLSHRSSREDNADGESDDRRHHKHSKRKHRSHRDDDDRIDERDRTHSRRRKSKDEDEENEEMEVETKCERSRRKQRAYCFSHHGREGHKYRERRSSPKGRRSKRYKRDNSLETESQNIKGSHSEREDLEEGEISSRLSNPSRGSLGTGRNREESVDVSSSFQELRAPSQPPETTEVSDDLRAKIRAMLMGTL